MFTPHKRSPRAVLIKRGQGEPLVGRLSRPKRTARDPGQCPARTLTDDDRLRPSLEAFTFVATVAEEGQAWLKGAASGAPGVRLAGPWRPPYNALLTRVNRIAYREFSRNPKLSF